MRRHKRFAILLTAISIIAAPYAALSTGKAAAQVAVAKSATAREATPELRRETFEIVWRTVKEKHFDPKLNGVDWDKVHDLYAPLVRRVKNDEEFYRLLQEMLGELHQSHFVVIPPEYTHTSESKEEVEAGLGVSIRIIDDRVVIWRVLADSPAARAEFRPGFVIKDVDGQSVQKIIATIKKRKETPASIEGRIIDTIDERFLGAPGSSIRLVYLDEKDHRHDQTIRREKLQGEMSPPVGDFPSFLTEFESKRLAGGIGYIRFSVFHPFLNQRIREAVRSMSDAPGIVIDLRGNTGGFDGVGQGLAGLLLDKKISLGMSRSRDGYENYIVYPQKNPYTGPIVILVDCMSGSASESFSGGMQSIGRAVIVGQTSGGADLDASVDKLPTGALLLYAYGDFVTAKGVSLEGRGVIPDIVVNLTRASLLSGNDSQLEAAINYIRKQSSQQQ